MSMFNIHFRMNMGETDHLSTLFRCIVYFQEIYIPPHGRLLEIPSVSCFFFFFYNSQTLKRVVISYLSSVMPALGGKFLAHVSVVSFDLWFYTVTIVSRFVLNYML